MERQLKPRLVISLAGGLGNQLFQYACGWSLAEKTGREAVLDVVRYGHYRLRPYLLDRLKVKARLASQAELRSWGLEAGILPRLRRRLFGTRIPTLKEKSFAWAAPELPEGFDARLDGYWQSELYFSGAAAELKRQFAVRGAAAGANAAWLREIRSAGSRAVAVHLRRGDYVSDKAAAAAHGALGPGYYRAAAKRIGAKLKRPLYFVFSDEPAWAAENMGFLKGARFAAANPPEAPEQDLRLMSACRHFVIANSSFSWWGAWLGEKAGSLVAAPRRWFQDPSRDASDIVPRRWLRLG